MQSKSNEVITSSVLEGLSDSQGDGQSKVREESVGTALRVPGVGGTDCVHCGFPLQAFLMDFLHTLQCYRELWEQRINMGCNLIVYLLGKNS